MIALPIFVIPFTFCYNPALLLQGNVVQVVIAVITALLGVFFIDICTVGYLKDKVGVALRGLFLVGGILLLMPQYLPSAIGFVLGIIAFILASRKPAVSVEG